MDEFLKYLEMGAFHILDIGGLDHLLFITSIALVYSFVSWKQVLIILTAFTLGHAISLIVMATGLVQVSDKIIEFLIPLTILITSLIHMIGGRQKESRMYALALIFGLIHGTAFAQGWEKMFGFSKEYIIATLGFNVGVELAQLLFGFLVIGIMALLTDVFKLSKEKVRLFIFAVIITLAVQYLWQNRLW